jgi:hypothetical protein
MNTLRTTVDDLGDRATSALVAEHPRRAAEIGLSLLVASLSATGAGVYRRAGDRLNLWVSQAIDHVDLDRVERAWAARAPLLRSVIEEQYALLVVPEAPGVVYVGARRTLSVAGNVADALMPLFRDALRSPDDGRDTIDDYLASVSVDQLQREHLALELERNEWNIARVARIMRVERSTIYERMRRFRIERKRVWKSR